MGADKINEDYFAHIKYLLECPFSVGIMGGKPREALYFLGYQENQLIYMDPHYVQDAYQFGNDQNNNKIIWQSYHQQSMQGISFTRIDSSLAFGFYVRNEEEFEVLYKYLLFGNIVFQNWAIGVQNKLEIDQPHFLQSESYNNMNDLEEEFEILK